MDHIRHTNTSDSSRQVVQSMNLVPHLPVMGRYGSTHVGLVPTWRAWGAVASLAVKFALTAGLLLAHNAALELAVNQILVLSGDKDHTVGDIVLADVVGMK
jgi:hypothetical protein